MSGSNRPKWTPPRRLSGRNPQVLQIGKPLGHLPSTKSNTVNAALAVLFLLLGGIGVLAFWDYIVHALRVFFAIPFLFGMAWTTPVAITTGDLVTAAMWNEQVIDNLQYLYDELWKRPDPEDYIQVGPSSTTETTVATWTLEGGSLGANGFFVVRLGEITWNNTGAGITCTIRIKLGATTLITLDSANHATHITNVDGSIVECRVANCNDETVQYGMAVEIGMDDDQALGSDDTATLSAVGGLVAAEDTTGDLNIVVTAQLSVSDASVYTKFFAIGLETIYNA